MNKQWAIALFGAGVMVLGVVGGISAAQTAFSLYSSLTGNEVVADQANPTGASFKTSVLRNYVLGGGGASILPVPNGGTGAASLTAHGVLLGEGTTAVIPTSAGASGALLQGTSSADPSFSTTLSGAYIFTNPVIQAGASAGTPTHVATGQTTAPALTSCGTGSPAITGTDTAGIITMGTGATGCVITFNVAYTATPYCVVSWIATPLASQSYVTSSSAITLTQTSTSGNKAQYLCFAGAGG